MKTTGFHETERDLQAGGEFLKEHSAFLEEPRKVRALEANAACQQKQIAVLTAVVQKVSAQLELSKAAPQTVLNNQ
jgi:hypothetical protein